MKPKSKIVIGLTGSIASGKSTVGAIFKKYGAKVIDADKLVAEIYEENPSIVGEIAKVFGKDVKTFNGNLDRGALAKIVFANRRKIKVLNNIVHPLTIRRIKQEIKRYKGLVIVDAPLLIESGLHRFVDYVLLLHCPLRLQLERASKKHKLSEDEIRQRLAVQLPFKDKKRYADFIIDNQGSLSELKSRIKEIYREVAR